MQTIWRHPKPEINHVEISATDSLDMAKDQKADTNIIYLWDKLMDGTLLKLSAVQLSSVLLQLRKLLIWAPDMKLVNDTLVVACTTDENDVYKLVVLLQLYEKVIKMTHARTLKHVGKAKTIAYFESYCIIQGIDKLVCHRIALC